ncbi:hypothetical protein NLI96_g7954 [Meripilus lineatus]|uniref:F-box domain-containing protein n=1 Tax=Meripilus lineatus TaxID=2056292 RepID=A0AAD5V2X0_9APHY|nr:hypothetical protein NLI96_g7954 [Physisporinus lineatus]
MESSASSSSSVMGIASQAETNFNYASSQQDHLTTMPPVPEVVDLSPPISSSDDNPSPPSSMSFHSPRDIFVPPSPHGCPDPLHQSLVRLRSPEGMKLPIELWLEILKYLSRDAMSLLACALTCRGLQRHAEVMIYKLRNLLTIDVTRYDDLNTLVEVFRTSPKLAREIGNRLELRGKSNESVPVVLSVLPIRLSTLLISVRKLQFRGFTIGSQPYPSRWSLYGHAFPNLTKLQLASVKFPSLKDFVALVTSFPALTTLFLVSLELENPVIPISIEIHNLEKHCIPWFLAIVAQPAHSLQVITIRVKPAAEDIQSFAWTRLDVVLSSWFIVNYIKHKTKLFLEFWVPRLENSNYLIESLFPLTTSLGMDSPG